MKFITKKQLIKVWDNLYGENLKKEYSGFYKMLPNKFTLADIEDKWGIVYGENFKSEYSGVWRFLNK